MKIVSINLGNYGSTGKIMEQIAEICRNRNHEYYCAYPASSMMNKKNKYDYIIQNDLFRKINVKVARIFGRSNKMSFFATLKFLKFLKKINPDIIHMHNLHDSYLNLKILFKFIKKNNISIVWTLHDCWAFTGRCPYFTILKCENWLTNCNNCKFPKNDYPQTLFGKSNKMFKEKKNWFSNVNNLKIVTPSQWLGDLVKKSFLKNYDVSVINNGIDLNVFQRKNEKIKFRNFNYIILGVAFDWGYRKGLDVFIELSKKISNEYGIVLVGTNENIDEDLPPNIISIHRTNNQDQLASIYSSASVFLNPTREENFPTVNIESLACGTPVITYNTGGSPEIIDSSCGFVVEQNDFDDLLNKIYLVCEKKVFKTENCIKRASHFNKIDSFEKYCDLYERMDI